MTPHLVPFLTESLRIEGITRPPLLPEIEATQKFLDLPRLTIDDVSALVRVYQPDAVIRDKKGMNVRVGSHVAPPGGPQVPRRLAAILNAVNAGSSSPYETHVAYESLHPYLDGNGRSGRAIWAWQMADKHDAGGLALLFLHRFYYQCLEAQR